MKKFIIRCVPSALESENCNVGKILGSGRWRYMRWGVVGEFGFSPVFFKSLEEADRFRKNQLGFPEIAQAQEMEIKQ